MNNIVEQNDNPKEQRKAHKKTTKSQPLHKNAKTIFWNFLTLEKHQANMITTTLWKHVISLEK